ncbi:chitotriosidase-1-like [Stomoxys calcitrans]|uniref:chitotriosidase-1-like n=1 Tax=Stomoxys calcitrans TaxID=35570 RepID=UPI0027E34D9F|nr:chitotriosidase-1-like [Stomoxys calcitrans]
MGDVEYVRHWYHIPQIVHYVKFINIMAYNYSAEIEFVDSYERKFHAPINKVKSTIEYWLYSGAPAEKLNLGIALIGRIFTKIGPPRHETFVYLRVVENLGKHDGKYTFNTDLGASQVFFPDEYKAFYESEQGVQMKVDFAKQKELGGVMIWTLDNDISFKPFYPLFSLIFRMFDKGF